MKLLLFALAVSLPFAVGYALLYCGNRYGNNTMTGVIAVIALIFAEYVIIKCLEGKD